MFSNLSLSSISFATETPSLLTVGAAKARSRTALRPLGASVPLTASARMFTPAISRARAFSLNLTSLAAMVVFLFSRFRFVGCSVHDGHDVFFAHHEQFLAVDPHGRARVFAEQDLVADLDVDGGDFPVVVLLAGTDSEDLALVGLLGGGVGDDDAGGGTAPLLEEPAVVAVLAGTT